MKGVLIWIVIWYTCWLLWVSIFKKIKHPNTLLSTFNPILYFSFFFYISFLYFNKKHDDVLYQWTSVVLVLSLPIIVGKNNYLEKNRYNLFSQVFCILFQQSMVFALIQLLKDYPINGISFALIFFTLHLPIVFVKWNKLRYLYLTLSLIGGLLFYYFINDFKYGIILSFLTHYSIYIITIPYYDKIAKTLSKLLFQN